MPFALYLDGVPYSQTDSVLGMWGLTSSRARGSSSLLCGRSCVANAGVGGGARCTPSSPWQHGLFEPSPLALGQRAATTARRFYGATRPALGEQARP